jgi:HEAT repeat protein
MPDNKSKFLILNLVFSIGIIFAQGKPFALAQHENENLLPILSSLKDKNPSIREGAVIKLSIMQPVTKEIASALITALGDEDEKVRSLAISVVAGITTPTGRNALNAIQYIKEATPILLKMARNEKSNYIRDRAWLVIASVVPNHKEAIQTTLKFARGEDKDLRKIAIKRLGHIQSPEGIPTLLDVLNNSDLETQLTGIYTLLELSPPLSEAIPPLIRIAKNDKEHIAVRTSAISVMTEISLKSSEEDHDRVASTINDLLRKDESKAIQFYGWTNLAKIEKGNQEAIKALIVFAEDTDRGIRHGAIKHLLEIGEKERLIPLLIKGLNDPESGERIFYTYAIMQIGSAAKQAIPNLIPLINDEEQLVKMRVIDILGKMGPEAKEAIPALQDAASNDALDEVRDKALEAIKKIQIKR